MAVNNRRSYLDMLRIIACFLVIFNHTEGYHAYLTNTDSLKAICYIPLSVLTKVAVPIFLMISGALLLSKDISYRDIFTKRIPRIATVLILSSLVMYLVAIRKDIHSFDPVFFLRNLLSGSHEIAYWYLYCYLGFLLELPWLRRIAKNLTATDFKVLLIGYCILSSLFPLINYVLGYFGICAFSLTKSFTVPIITASALFYPLIGYCIDQVFDIEKLNRKTITVLCAVFLAGVGISMLVTYHQGTAAGYTQDYVGLFDYLLAICIFLFVKYWFTHTEKRTGLHRFVTFVGPLTFGIYLMDPALKITWGLFNSVITLRDPVLHSFIWCIFSMFTGGFITFLFKKIPFINKLL